METCGGILTMQRACLPIVYVVVEEFIVLEELHVAV